MFENNQNNSRKRKFQSWFHRRGKCFIIVKISLDAVIVILANILHFLIYLQWISDRNNICYFFEKNIFRLLANIFCQMLRNEDWVFFVLLTSPSYQSAFSKRKFGKFGQKG